MSLIALIVTLFAGKTTLLTALASQNKYGRVYGKFAYCHSRGTFVSDDFARKHVALVPQFEAFPGLLTIKEVDSSFAVM